MRTKTENCVSVLRGTKLQKRFTKHTSEWSFLISLLRRPSKSIFWFISEPLSRWPRDVLSSCLYYHKTKPNTQNRSEIKRVWGTGQSWDKILVNTLVKWITDWEATRFQALSLSRPLSDRRLITEQLTSTCPVIYTSDPSIVFYGISRTPYKGNYLFNRAWRSVTIDSNQCSPLVEMRMEFLQRQNSVTKTAREATVNMVQHVTN